MYISLERLRRDDPLYLVDGDEAGFNLVRAPAADQARFDALVRAAMAGAGRDFVALPRSDGHTGYDAVYILPLGDGA